MGSGRGKSLKLFKESERRKKKGRRLVEAPKIKISNNYFLCFGFVL